MTWRQHILKVGLCRPHFWLNWNLEVLVFNEKGKPWYPEKNLSEQGREPTTNSTHKWLRHQDLNHRHIGGRRVLSPLLHLCSPVSVAPPAMVILAITFFDLFFVRYIAYLSTFQKIYCQFIYSFVSVFFNILVRRTTLYFLSQ